MNVVLVRRSDSNCEPNLTDVGRSAEIFKYDTNLNMIYLVWFHVRQLRKNINNFNRQFLMYTISIYLFIKYNIRQNN